MKRSLLIKGIIALLIVVLLGFNAVGCFLFEEEKPDDGDGDGDTEVIVDKTALEAELALEVTDAADYTTDSYNAYLDKLSAAKAILADEDATQDSVDKATADLTDARLALEVRPVYELSGAAKSFTLTPGESIEISISDYVDPNGVGNLTYKVKTGNAVASVSPVSDGKFTISAGDVNQITDLTVSIIVSKNGRELLKVDLAIRITNEVAPTLIADEVVKEYDMVSLVGKDSITIDFASNVKNLGNVAIDYTAKLDGEELSLSGSTYTLTLGSYTEEYTYLTFEVTASCMTNDQQITLQYTYKLGLKDTCRYNVLNGNFESGLDGWTFVNILGDAPFAGIDSKTLYWVQQFPMNNVGSYFSAYADGASEASQGTLASSYFIVNSEYATYMLGGGGNPGVYITIENKDGQVLALYRNTMFADLPADVTDFDAQRELVGHSVFLANFVTYKVSLAEFAGQEVRFVIHDYASSDWGVVFFDELNAYYTSQDEIPENAILAENLLADKSLLLAELALEVTAQGDYTLESFSAYLEKLSAAKALLDSATVSQESVDKATAELSSARLALAVRPVLEVEGANKIFSLISGNSKEINISDFIDTNGLSSITYAIASGSDILSVGPDSNGNFTVTAGQVDEETSVELLITVYYSGAEKLSVKLTVTVTNDLTPTLYSSEVVKEYDLYTLEGGLIIDLSANVNNAGNLQLTYAVDGSPVVGSLYTVTLGNYTDTYTYTTLTVTASYVANGEQKSVSYTVKLGLKDTTDYRLENGGFEDGLDGWTVVGSIGDVSSDRTYWVEEIEFGMDGDKMFSAYAPGALESAVGYLTSSSFKVGGSGFVTFKIGAMRDANYVYVDVVEAGTGKILARYYNGLWSDEELGGCKLVAYKADLSSFMGREVYFRISDNADSGYGLFFADSFVTYYESEPEEFNAATPVSYAIDGTIYDLFNGGFEMGDVQGWWNNGEIGVVTDAEGFWGDNILYGKDGNFLFTGVESFGADTMREGNKGTLTSSAFELGGIGYISFMLGGGDNPLCYVQVIDATTGVVLAKYRQQAQNDAVLVQYVADLSAFVGRTVRIQVVDNASSGWGCVSFDNVVTYYTSLADLPDGLTAINVKSDARYDIENGSFENGLEGWTMNITEAGVHNTLGWVIDTEMDAEWYTKNDDTKDGNYLFTFVQPGDVNCESSKGTLESSTFSLRQGAFVSFKFGAAGGAQNHDVYIELCRADGSVIARFYNDAPDKVNTKMNAYYYQYTGEEVECFFRVVDNSTSDYGCLVIDDFRVNLESAPEGYIAAIQ